MDQWSQLVTWEDKESGPMEPHLRSNFQEISIFLWVNLETTAQINFLKQNLLALKLNCVCPIRGTDNPPYPDIEGSSESRTNNGRLWSSTIDKGTTGSVQPVSGVPCSSNVFPLPPWVREIVLRKLGVSLLSITTSPLCVTFFLSRIVS